MSKFENAKAIMSCANIWKEQSHCVRLKVGAVLVSDDGKIISTGYNGTKAGFSVNCNDLFKIEDNKYFINIMSLAKFESCDSSFLKNFSKNNSEGFIEVTKENFLEWHHKWSDIYEIHAEPNCILSALTDGTHSLPENMTLFVTTAPCEQCCKLIASVGIKKVVYGQAYDRIGVDHIKDVLSKFGVSLIQYDDYMCGLNKDPID